MKPANRIPELDMNEQAIVNAFESGELQSDLSPERRAYIERVAALSIQEGHRKQMQSQPLNRTEILDILREHKQELAEKYGVSRLGIFGSVARNEHSDCSDVDVIAEMPPNYSHLVQMKDELELLLQASVDLIRYQRHLSEFFQQRLEQEAIYV